MSLFYLFILIFSDLCFRHWTPPCFHLMKDIKTSSLRRWQNLMFFKVSSISLCVKNVVFIDAFLSSSRNKNWSVITAVKGSSSVFLVHVYLFFPNMMHLRDKVKLLIFAPQSESDVINEQTQTNMASVRLSILSPFSAPSSLVPTEDL